MEEMAKLTDKQEKFCYEYVLHLNATKAAINAGYSEKTAFIIGSENLRKPYIKERIRYMQDNLAETAQLSALRVLKEHEKIAYSSIAHMHQTWVERKDFEELTDDQKDCIKSISTKILKKNIGTKEDPEIVDVEYVKIELYDKQKALDAINQMLGYNAPTKSEVLSNMTISTPKTLDDWYNKNRNGYEANTTND
jgi:phage terminase small subunit